MIIITYRPLYCVFALKLGIPSRKFLAPPLHTLERGHILLGVLLEHGALWHRPACHGVAAGQDERIQAGEPLLAARTLLSAVNFGYYTLCARLYKHQKY